MCYKKAAKIYSIYFVSCIMFPSKHIIHVIESMHVVLFFIISQRLESTDRIS